MKQVTTQSHSDLAQIAVLRYNTRENIGSEQKEFAVNNRCRHLAYGVVGAACSAFLTGCKLAILNPKGQVAIEEKNLLIDAILLMLLVVVPVIIMTFWFAWRYRSSNKKAVYQPSFRHSNTIEFFCWGIPIIIIAILAKMTWTSSHRLDPYRQLEVGGKPMVIQAISLNWKWLFIYPEQNIATVNTLTIPANRQILFKITSDAPMNALEIPQLAGQVYAMGGMQTKLHVIANHPGTYRGLSTSFSGDGFAGMHFKIHAVSEQQYQQWIKTVKGSKKVLSQSVYDELAKDSENEPVHYYSQVKPTLYHDTIMKFMLPKSKADFGKRPLETKR